MNLTAFRAEWAPNITRDLLAGTVVALALIPEAIAFSIIAGVDPKVGLYASFCIAVVTAIAGGRPAMISAATGSTALVMVTLVNDHGLSYLFAATILTGVFQVIASAIRLGDLMRFVSRSVVTGFVNALAILIFMAQLPELIGHGWQVYAMVAVGLGIIYGLPRVFTALPAPLVAIVVLTGFTMATGLHLHAVGDMGELPGELPFFALPQVPLNLETLLIIVPYALTLTMVGLLESLMTAAIIDEMTDTGSNKNRECAGQGLANMTSGLFGGMAGCAMIGQSVINVSSGGRGRLSCLWAGCFLLFLIVVLGPWVKQIPMAALVAVMIMVSINTFSWRSLPRLRTNPWPSSVVMLATVGTVVATRNLSAGVLVGVLLSGVFFAGKVSRLSRISSALSAGGQQRTYYVEGQVFFASAGTFADAIDVNEPVARIVIDVGAAHFWDISAIAALDRVVMKARRHGRSVEVIGLNAASATMVERFAVHRQDGAAAPLH